MVGEVGMGGAATDLESNQVPRRGEIDVADVDVGSIPAAIAEISGDSDDIAEGSKLGRYAERWFPPWVAGRLLLLMAAS